MPPRPAKPIAHVLLEDPDLGDSLDPARLARASRLAVAPVVELPAGAWQPLSRPAEPVFGLLLLDGVVGNRLAFADRSHLELLGPGDVLRPWVGLGPAATTPARVDWWVFRPGRACMLDSRFCLAIRDLPETYEALADRLVMRARRLNLQLVVNALNLVEDRVLAMLWHFAGRWGTVTPAGVVLRVRLSHRDIADIVAARRPSVSAALMRLRRSGAIVVRDDGWLLVGAPPARLRELEAHAALVSDA